MAKEPVSLRSWRCRDGEGDFRRLLDQLEQCRARGTARERLPAPMRTVSIGNPMRAASSAWVSLVCARTPRASAASRVPSLRATAAEIARSLPSA